MAAFAGIGEVAPKLTEFPAGNLLPSVGAGLRFMVSGANRVPHRGILPKGKRKMGSIFTSERLFRER
jgi:hypothetical protein